MPRKPRFNLVGAPQHVIQRGNNRGPCFFSEQDYQRYLEDLRHASTKFKCRIHAYVLMTNHVHLLVTPMVDFGISQMMQALGRRYVRYINQTYLRTGTLWEGRYKSSLVDAEQYLLTCMRYIELNPVRAGMVIHPAEYEWSSYAANAQGSTDQLIDIHSVYRNLGSTLELRRTAYRVLFSHHVDPEIVNSIREALNQELVLGRSDFKQKIERVTQRQTRRRSPGRPRVNEDQSIYQWRPEEY